MCVRVRARVYRLCVVGVHPFCKVSSGGVWWGYVWRWRRQCNLLLAVTSTPRARCCCIRDEEGSSPIPPTLGRSFSFHHHCYRAVTADRSFLPITLPSQTIVSQIPVHDPCCYTHTHTHEFSIVAVVVDVVFVDTFWRPRPLTVMESMVKVANVIRFCSCVYLSTCSFWKILQISSSLSCIIIIKTFATLFVCFAEKTML